MTARPPIEWLMTPDARRPTPEPEPDDILRRPEWHRAAWRGVWPDVFIRGPKADHGTSRTPCEDYSEGQRCLEITPADDSLGGLWTGLRTPDAA